MKRKGPQKIIHPLTLLGVSNGAWLPRYEEEEEEKSARPNPDDDDDDYDASEVFFCCSGKRKRSLFFASPHKFFYHLEVTDSTIFPQN